MSDDIIDSSELINLLRDIEAYENGNKDPYVDPVLIVGSDGKGKCTLIEILNEDKVDMSFWGEELKYFFDDDGEFKLERGLFKCSLYCHSYKTFNGEDSEWNYHVDFVSSPEKIYDWGDLSC